MSSNLVGGQLTRQPPGSACGHCRNKKMKCDAHQPRCRNCFVSGVECIRSNGQSRKRGPRKDHSKISESRRGAHQTEMANRDIYDAQSEFNPDYLYMDLPIDPFNDLGSDVLDNITSDAIFSIPPSIDSLPPMIPSENTEISQAHMGMDSLSLLNPCLDDTITELMHADLDQLYLDRIHRLVPILNRQRYFSWTRSLVKTDEQICLQYTMWTLVVSQSAQLQHLREAFYQHTCSLLDRLTAQDTITLHIEYAQACILIVYYDLMKENFRRGWISAGRCIRVVQLMRLFEVDRPQAKADRHSWIEHEEKRRAFWIAYSLDIFISLRGEWPLSLSGYTAFVRLPALEKDFDNNQYVEMPFLSTVLSSKTPCVLSPLAESIVFATFIRHIRAPIWESTEDRWHCDTSNAFGENKESLNNILRIRLKALRFKYQDAHLPFSDDPLEIFAMMIAQSSILHLYSSQKSLEIASDSDHSPSLALQYEAQMAAQEISNLSTSIFPLSLFKVESQYPSILVFGLYKEGIH
ncbi:hypothetical protein N7456_000005 [Penicillium angulare]|uniref:Zn(2)-C6 fungal-type domain-containing protein n=1 Tax=Penicillium angulare TaxID=116970 RepID=A0A9W9GBP8_9EURO|nr:hypothetical protein N7456_000005 [Penicillium angulare]